MGMGRRNGVFMKVRSRRTIKRRRAVVVVCIHCMCGVGRMRWRGYGRWHWVGNVVMLIVVQCKIEDRRVNWKRWRAVNTECARFIRADLFAIERAV